MIDILSSAQVVLREAGFTTRLTSMEHAPVVSFEDETLIGFSCIFDNASTLLSRWKSTEMSLLARYAATLRIAGEKAWNVYSVFLCGSSADTFQNRQIRWIEEDLERTRKITGCGIATREDLIRVLLPLLPLQYQPVLRTEDVVQRLRKRITTIAPKAADVALDDTVPPIEIVRLLGGSA